jgi:hypothetical protein
MKLGFALASRGFSFTIAPKATGKISRSSPHR